MTTSAGIMANATQRRVSCRESRDNQQTPSARPSRRASPLASRRIGRSYCQTYSQYRHRPQVRHRRSLRARRAGSPSFHLLQLRKLRESVTAVGSKTHSLGPALLDNLSVMSAASGIDTITPPWRILAQRAPGTCIRTVSVLLFRHGRGFSISVSSELETETPFQRTGFMPLYFGSSHQSDVYNINITFISVGSRSKPRKSGCTGIVPAIWLYRNRSRNPKLLPRNLPIRGCPMIWGMKNL